MRIHALQHVAFEGLGHIGQWAADRGHSVALTRLYAGDPLPRLAEVDRLVIMGGPMNIYEDDRYPWLPAERLFIRQAVEAGKSAVGICLGAQLLANALGSKVVAGEHKEIGWWPIRLTEAGYRCGFLEGLPAQPTVFHWHGDTFAIPAGAIHLAASEGCHSQAFLFDNRILGLQFHLESTPETVQALLDHCRDELVPGRYIQAVVEIGAADSELFTGINRLLATLLDRLA